MVERLKRTRGILALCDFDEFLDVADFLGLYNLVSTVEWAWWTQTGLPSSIVLRVMLDISWSSLPKVWLNLDLW